MESSSWQFTSSDELDGFQAGDTSMDLARYVDSIEGIKELRTSQKYVMNYVLIWGKDAAKYAPMIKLHDVIEITMGTIGQVNPRFNVSGENLDTEFHVQSASNLIFHGHYANASLQAHVNYTEVTMDNII